MREQSTPVTSELKRVREEYDARERRLAGSDLYSPFNPASLFMSQRRQRAELGLLRRYGFSELQNCRILEVGCGRGGVLNNYLGYGAVAANLHGVDLLPDRLVDAKKRLPTLPLVCADGQHLPYEDASFDLLMQYTVFSSVLDESIRARMAAEMLRVLRKPGGLIVWYDFWLNPTNKQTRGIRPAEIKRLFPGCEFEFHRITLAPPVARVLVPVSWTAAALLEKIRLLNTHYLVAIRVAR